MGASEPRPTALTVMAEHSVDDPVWDRPLGSGGPVELSALGVGEDLVARLRAWNHEYERLSLTDPAWPGSQAEEEWRRTGLGLARALQAQLPDVEVHYWHGDGPR